MLLTVHAHGKPRTDNDAYSHRLLLWKLLWLKGNKFYFLFHYETKYSVIFSPSKKESKEVSTARLVQA